MRLNHFLRFSKRPGPARRLLRRVAPSWQNAPVRRLVQAAALLLFLALFFHVAWPYGGYNYAVLMERKQWIDAELFLALDPLVSIAAAIATRAWVWSLPLAGLIIAAGLVLPRFFCGYLCPLGTIIDLFDWTIGRRVRRFRLKRVGWWRHLRFFVLAAVLVSAAGGVLLTGYLAAIPLLTRALQLGANPLDLGLRKGWHQLPPMHAGYAAGLGLFAVVLLLGLLRPRFWCRHLCPSGALLSALHFLRLTERKVSPACTRCGQCRKACSFDAINDDFSTRTADCTLCQTCGGACPIGGIDFASRWSDWGDGGDGGQPAPVAVPSESKRARLSRRGFLCGSAVGAVGGLAWMTGIRRLLARGGNNPPAVRPPGSVPEDEFLRLCVRCGECMRVCPNNVLQPVGLDGGPERLWTPQVVADWSGCEPTCNNCTQVCPTGAIRALTLTEKRWTRMGLAVIDTAACLPHAGREACQMCKDECDSSGYRAIEFRRVYPNARPAPAPADTPADGGDAQPPATPLDEPPAIPLDEPPAIPLDEPPAMPTDEPSALPMDDAPAMEIDAASPLSSDAAEPVAVEADPSSDAAATPAMEIGAEPASGDGGEPAGLEPVLGAEDGDWSQGFEAPVVDPLRCVGCGLCQTRCYRINVAQKGLLDGSAIVIVAGGDNEDRLRDGTALDLRAAEAAQRIAERRQRGRFEFNAFD